MTFRKRISGVLTLLGATVASLGCGGNGSSSVTVPPPPISISPASVTVQPGSTQQFAATINTGSGATVTWTLTCSSVPCGTVSPTSTASGAPTTYTPPVTLPAANLSVTLTASSTTDSTKFASASATVPQIAGFSGISESHVDTVNGVARLIVNGQPAPPLWFRYPQNFPNNIQFLAPEAQDAASAGVNTISVSLNSWPWDNQNTAPLDFSVPDQVLDNVMAANPRALLIVNVVLTPGTGWKPPVPLTSADYILYPDGVSNNGDSYHISMASDTCFNGFLTSIPHLLQHYENSSYADHILGYILNWGGTGEWYPVELWRGPDYSPVNTQHFQAWLQQKYGTDADLSAAWGMPVTIATAQVPAPQSGRFPMYSIFNGPPGATATAFYQLPQEQDWVDYSSYVSDLTLQRIIAGTQAIKSGSANKRLVGVHNGYLIELMGSFNGHLDVNQILSSQNVDFLGGAFTYLARNAGNAGQEGVPVDSYNANGKLWFNEIDLCTYLSEHSSSPPVICSGSPTSSVTETVDVLSRELASILVHRSGTWWFDINEDGGYTDPSIWALMSQYGSPEFNEIYANPKPLKPDVALIIDRNSILYQRSDEDMFGAQRAMLRYALAKAGVSYGIYTLDDFIDGVLPPSQVYIFANTNYLTDSQITQMHSRLNAEGSTAIWQYAPGFLGPNGSDVTRASTLTGIQLSQSDGYGYTNGTGSMAGYNWGLIIGLPNQNNNPISPRLTVNDPAAETLGVYQTDGLVSSARKKVGNFESIFSGEYCLGDFYNPLASDYSPSPDALRALLQIAGVHIWSSTGDVIMTDGNLLVIHAAAAGPDAISLPAGVSATPLGGGTPSTGTLNINFSRVGETQWFQLSQSSQGTKSPVHRRAK